MIKVMTEYVKCSECAKSEKEGCNLFCTEFEEIIDFNEEVLCSSFEKENKTKMAIDRS